MYICTMSIADEVNIYRNINSECVCFIPTRVYAMQCMCMCKTIRSQFAVSPFVNISLCMNASTCVCVSVRKTYKFFTQTKRTFPHFESINNQQTSFNYATKCIE